MLIMAMNVPELPILQISEFPSYPRVVPSLPPFTVAVLFMDFMPHCQVIKFHPQGLPYTDQFEKFTTVSSLIAAVRVFLGFIME